MIDGFKLSTLNCSKLSSKDDSDDDALDGCDLVLLDHFKFDYKNGKQLGAFYSYDDVLDGAELGLSDGTSNGSSDVS